jgi:hypothetical protein
LFSRNGANKVRSDKQERGEQLHGKRRKYKKSLLGNVKIRNFLNCGNNSWLQHGFDISQRHRRTRQCTKNKAYILELSRAKDVNKAIDLFWLQGT